MKIQPLLLFLVLGSILFILSCSDRKPAERVVGTVNNNPILLSELQREVAVHLQQHPGVKPSQVIVEDHLKAIIERKLMIQEAVKAKITEDEQFAETIKLFWEQTLIRELIRIKNREFNKSVVATDQDIRRMYDRARYDVVARVARAGDRSAAEDLGRRMKDSKPVDREETVGPFFYDSVKLTPLENAFDMQPGEIGIFPSDDEFVVLRVVQKRSVTTPPIESMHDTLLQAVLEMKREKSMIDWLNALKRSSTITINRDAALEAIHAK